MRNSSGSGRGSSRGKSSGPRKSGGKFEKPKSSGKGRTSGPSSRSRSSDRGDSNDRPPRESSGKPFFDRRDSSEGRSRSSSERPFSERRDKPERSSRSSYGRSRDERQGERPSFSREGGSGRGAGRPFRSEGSDSRDRSERPSFSGDRRSSSPRSGRDDKFSKATRGGKFSRNTKKPNLKPWSKAPTGEKSTWKKSGDDDSSSGRPEGARSGRFSRDKKPFDKKSFDKKPYNKTGKFSGRANDRPVERSEGSERNFSGRKPSRGINSDERRERPARAFDDKPERKAFKRDGDFTKPPRKRINSDNDSANSTREKRSDADYSGRNEREKSEMPSGRTRASRDSESGDRIKSRSKKYSNENNDPEKSAPENNDENTNDVQPELNIRENKKSSRAKEDTESDNATEENNNSDDVKGELNVREKKPLQRKSDRDDPRGRSASATGDRKWNRKEDSEFYGDKKKKNKKSTNTEKSENAVRLNRYISNAGICSRREADELIKAGVVSVNGEVITEMGYQVEPGDTVKYNNEALKTERLVYVLLNKPKDFITTTDDPDNRKTVMSLIEKAGRERIYPVGRLDRNTTGLLLFTNDGDLAKALTHPSFGVHKVYQVELDKNLKATDMDQISKGLMLDDGMIKVDEIVYASAEKNIIGVEIHSGKNRIVRRIFEHLGYEVKKLDRVIFAGLTKKDLPRGRWRFLSEMEIAGLKMMTGKKRIQN